MGGVLIFFFNFFFERRRSGFAVSLGRDGSICHRSIARNINRKQNRSYRLKHQRNENKLGSSTTRYHYNSDWQRRASRTRPPLYTYPPPYFFSRRGTCFIVPPVEHVRKNARDRWTPPSVSRHVSHLVGFLWGLGNFICILHTKRFFPLIQECRKIFIRNTSRVTMCSHSEKSYMRNTGDSWIFFPLQYLLFYVKNVYLLI